MTIEKKCHPPFFQAILEGTKKYDLRLADWECKPGDTIRLREWDPTTQRYTGRELERVVTFVGVFKVDELFWPKEEIEKHGLMVLSLEEI